MPLELSPITPLLSGLDTKARSNCIGVGAAIKRQQQWGHWGGNLVVATLDRSMLYPLPVLKVAMKTAQNMGIPAILRTHHPDACAMLYEDQDGAAWCIRLEGANIPPIQEDLFQHHAKVAVLI